MSHGKTVCQHLKAIRRDIARENGIDLEIPECTFKGECCGTCPQCESELRTLEQELAKRISIGKVATVAGLALTLATPLAAQNVEPQKQPTPINATEPIKDSIPILKDTTAQRYSISGVVTDSEIKEPIPIVTVVLKYKDIIIAEAQTDFDGKYVLQYPADKRKYQLEVTCWGYKKYLHIIGPPSKELQSSGWNRIINIELLPSSTYEFPVMVGLWKEDFLDVQQKIKYDGMEVKVKY